MENIFKESKSNVINNGFLERVMENVATIDPPARSSYRAPTLLAAVVMIVAITLLTATVGVDTMNKKYEKWCASITLHHSQPLLSDKKSVSQQKSLDINNLWR